MKPSPGRESTDMAGPSWLAITFAAVVILAGAYSASRVAISRLRGRATEFDADALHAVMGAAMAGMLVPRLSVLPYGAWMAVFGAAAAWFGWRTVRTRGLAAVAGSPSRHPAPHLIECAAMLYMLLPVHGSHPAHGGAGVAMAGMGASARPAGRLGGYRLRVCGRLRGWRRRCGRQQHLEHRALAGRAAGAGRAVVGLRDRLHDGQAEPEPAGLAGPPPVGPGEPVEDPLQVRRGDAGARVRDRQDHMPVLTAGAEAEEVVGGGV